MLRVRMNMLRVVAGSAVAAHGLIHCIGFVVPWGIASVAGFAYRTTALGGALAVGDTGVKVIGLAWLGCAVGFVVAGIGIWRLKAWAPPLTAALAAVSLAVCLLGLPETAAGIAVNIGILVAAAGVSLAGSRRREVAR